MMKISLKIILAIFITITVFSCDPAYIKIYLIEKNEEEIYSKSNLELYGKDYGEISAVVDSICRKHNFEIHKYPTKEGYVIKEYTYDTKSSILIISLTPKKMEDANIVLSLMDFGSTKQSSLSKEIEAEIIKNFK